MQKRYIFHDREKGGTVPVKVNMNIETCEGFSGHSDKRQLMRYLRTIRPRPKIVLLNHGDPQNANNLQMISEEKFVWMQEFPVI